MDRFDFYKELFHQENQRKIELNNSLSIPISIIFAIITASFFMLANFDFSEIGVIKAIFIFILSLVIIFSFLSIWNLMRAFSDIFSGSYEYLELPYATTLENRYNELKEHFEKHNDDLEKADLEFNKDLKKYFIEGLDKNTHNNDKKAMYLYLARRQVAYSAIALSLLLIPFGINFIPRKDLPEQMVIEDKRKDCSVDHEKMMDSLKNFLIIKLDENGREKGTSQNSPKDTSSTSSTPSQSR